MNTSNLKAAIERHEKFKSLAKMEEQSIKDLVVKMQKQVEANEIQAVVNSAKRIEQCNQNRVMVLAAMVETKFEVDFFTYVDKVPGFETFVPLFEEMLQDDIEWYGRIKAMSRQDRRELTKSAKMIADMTESAALKLFRDDLLARFAKLSKQIEDKVGTIHSVNVQRNDNSKFDGIVHGDEGSAFIDTHYAGGWNIQRLHLRTRVTICN